MGGRGVGWWVTGLAVLVVLSVTLVAEGAPQGLPRDFQWEQLQGDLDYPADFDFLPRDQADRVLIAEKRGVVRLAVGGVVQDQPFLDISSQVYDRGEMGLVSITVDTDFQSNRFIYCLFAFQTADPSDYYSTRVGRLSRFRVNNSLTSANPHSEKILLGAQVPADPGFGCTEEEEHQDMVCLAFSHNIGGLDMDDEGYLFVSFGDNSDPHNPGEGVIRAQRLGTMVAKVIRIDREGRAPASNPWFDGDEFSNESRTFALGFRNGFRLSHDRKRQVMWLADVGWNDSEEINLLQAGNNYEWPCRQGWLDQFQFGELYPECANMLSYSASSKGVEGTPTGPSIVYSHNEGTAATGVVPMFGSSWPEEYRNALFYVDYSVGWLRYNIMDDNGQSVDGPFTLAVNLDAPVQIREGADGCLWYLSINLQAPFKICYVPDTSAPEVLHTSPAKDSVMVERTVSINVAISKPVTRRSAMNGVVLTEVSSGTEVAGSSSYDKDKLKITFTPSEPLPAWRNYCISVSGLKDDKGRSMDGKYEHYFKTGGGFTLFVSDLVFDSATSGGNRPVLRDEAKFGGVPIQLSGVQYAKGLSVIPESNVVVIVPNGCARLQGAVGVDDSSNALEDVELVLKIRVDGKNKFSSFTSLGRRMAAGDPPISFDIPVERGSEVILKALSPNPVNTEDTIISWGALRLRCGKYDSDRPHVVVAYPEAGEEHVPVNPMATITFSETMDVSSVARGILITDTHTGLPVAWEAVPMSSTLDQIALDTGALGYDRIYEVKMSAGVTDIAGNSIVDAGDFEVWHFFTEQEPAEPTTIDVFDELVAERTSLRGTLVRTSYGYLCGADVKVQFEVPHPSCTNFRGSLQIDDYLSVYDAKMTSRVLGDEEFLDKPPTIRYGERPVYFDTDITGRKKVQLKLLQQGTALEGTHVAIFSDIFMDCSSTARRPHCDIAPMTGDFAVGDDLHFRANAYSFAGVPLPNSAIRWDISLVHCAPTCHVHPHAVIIGQPEGSITVPNHGDYFYFRFNCVVEDEGLTTRSFEEVYPHTVAVSLTSEPQGVRAAIGGVLGETPLTTEVVLGTTFPVSVKRGSSDGSQFVSWEHSGATEPTFEFTLSRNSPIIFNALYEQKRKLD